MEPALTELTQLMKERLNKTSVNQAHSVTKGSFGCVVLTKFTRLTQENHFRINVHQARLANEEFPYVYLIEVFNWFQLNEEIILNCEKL